MAILPFLWSASLCAFPAPQAPPAAVWIEGESAARSELFTASTVALPDGLSGKQWLSLSIPEGEVDQKVAGEGLTFSLPLPNPGQGKRAIWARVGFENARSAFSWRVGGGGWTKVPANTLHQDLAYLGEWTDAGWIKLGDFTFPAGPGQIDFLVHKGKDDQGKPIRMLFALDALAVVEGSFRPDGPRKPGEGSGLPEDKEAEEKVFPAPGSEGRQSVRLEGLWQVARWDEQLPGPTATPIPPPPGASELAWSSIPVPSDRNVSRPDLTFGHRLWYRTKVRFPEGAEKRGHTLSFPLNSLNTTVYVNGVFCGFNPDPFVPWQADISQAVKPGINEIWVGIRDAWYGFSASPTNPLKQRRMFNYPPTWANRGFMDLGYPLWNAFQSGILETPVLTSTGPVFVEDVFVKTAMAGPRLTAEYSLRGREASPRSVQLVLEAKKNGATVWSHTSQPISLSAEGTAKVEAGGVWEKPDFWWPDDPQMHDLVTTVKDGEGRILDVHTQPFGFREWGSRGKDFTLNGVIWRGWAELPGGETPEAFLANYRRTHQRFMRLSGVSQNGGYRWKGLPKHEALAFFDRSGVVVRRSGLLDGQMIGHMAIENDPELQQLYGSTIKMELMENWGRQMAALARAERNHPSIQIWSLENEWLYINCINLYGDRMDEFEKAIYAVSDKVRQADPTRLTMVDGGGAGRTQGLPVHGDHYVYTNDPRAYPDLAYEAFPTGGGRGRWVWDQQRPRYLGEDFFASGINPSDYAWIQGETAFQGKAAAEKGYALVQRMLTEGYRWGGHYAAWHLWIGEEGGQHGKHKANLLIAAFFRERDWTVASGGSLPRTLGLFNDSFRRASLKVTLSGLAGTPPIEAALDPGGRQILPLTLKAPAVKVRTEIPLVVSVASEGKEVFRDQVMVSVLPPPAPLKLTRQAALYDPSGKAGPLLEKLGVKAFPLQSLDRLPASATLLIIGPGALTSDQANSSALAAWAAPGRRVVALEQENPLQGQGLPALMEVEGQQGSFAFLEDPSHPLVQGLQDKDFFTWPGGLVYRSAYSKPERGGRSLLQAGSQLKLSLLAEVPAGEGVLLLCQARVGDAGSQSAAALQLLRGLLAHADAYKVTRRPVSAFVDPSFAQVLNQIGVKKTLASSPLEALATAGGVAVVSASPQNLKALAGQPDRVRRFTEGGGRLLLQGLTPEGLESFNQLVGVDHLIRPFRREKVSLATPRDPLSAGISLGDVSLLSSERMFTYNDDKFVSGDTFSYVVSLDDAAPFAALPAEDLYLTVNGLVSSDSWRYIYSFGLDGQKPEYGMTWPKPQTFTEIEWTGNGFYHLVTKFELVFDGKERQVFEVQPNTQPQALAINPPRTATRVELRILDWQRRPETGQNVVGIDNIRLKVQRPEGIESRVKPLLNIGGLVRYPKGQGAIILSNLKFPENEDVPANGARKRGALATLLRNLEADFGGGAAVIAGEALDYQPVDLSRSANQYRTERGWFGDPSLTFKDLPGGRQVLAGVPYQVFDFATSPVPTVVMLGGEGIPNGLASSVTIPVGVKADALFFLLAARVDQPLSDEERRRGARPEMAQIEVLYADGGKEVIPLRLEEDLADYRQNQPRHLPGAQIAWRRPWAGTNLTAVAYSKQWSSPRPDQAITSVTLRFGPDRRGTPAVLAVTAARRPAKN